MLTDIENMDIMLGSNHFEREESELSISVRRPQSPSYNAVTNHDLNSIENDIRGFAGNGQNSRDADSSGEIIRRSGELKQRITQEINDLMSCVSTQIQRAIIEAINEQVLPQIQATLRFRPRKGWIFLAEGPEYRPEDAFNCRFRSSSRDEFPRNLNRDASEEDAQDMFNFFSEVSMVYLLVLVPSKICF